MHFQKELSEVAGITPETFCDIRRHIDTQWVEEALQTTGTATLRKRRLPAEQVVWLVIAMALFRNRSIAEVLAKLDLALPGRSSTVAPSAIPQARSRLGAEPLEWLFGRCAQEWAPCTSGYGSMA